MKFLVVLVCALAAASASHVASPIVYAAHHGYHGPQHLPIIDHEGVPVDTADVQIAKAAHLSQKVHVAARNGDLAVHAPVVDHSVVVAAHAAPVVAHSAVVAAHAAPVVAHSAVVAAHAAPVVAHSAVVSAHAAPVVAAHTAYSAGLASPYGIVGAHHGIVDGHHSVLGHSAYTHSAYAHPGHGFVDAHHGVVAHSAYAHHGHGLVYRKRRGVIAAPVAYHAYHGYHGAQHLPLINHEGVPVDTADVQLARAAHLSEKVHVAARNGDYAIHAPVVAHSAYAHHDGVYGHHHAYSAPWAHYY